MPAFTALFSAAKFFAFSAAAIFCLLANTAEAQVSVDGTLKKWHPLTLDVRGATNTLDESQNNPNPFLDFRFDVTFTAPDGTDTNVPGFFAGDGIGNGIGDVWRARFAPNAVGVWNYTINFTSGPNIAVGNTAGTTLPINDTSGSFTITAQDNDDLGFLKYGRLEYIGEHYLKFADGPYWIKGGIDSPENFFGYAGFDNTEDQPGGANTGALQDGLHRYTPHIVDWSNDDPLFPNSATPDSAKGIIGAINYLANQSVNSIYFLPMNLGGDGRETYPFIGATGSDFDNTHYDISKLFQWNIVLEHMQARGIATHFVLAEIEQDNTEWLDGGALGIQRKLFFRELIARFSYLLAIKWNLSEESRLGTAKHKAFAAHIRQLDWANHPITVHTKLNEPANRYDDLLTNENFDATSIQFSPSRADEFVETWREKSAASGRPWVIDMDEVGTAVKGLNTDNVTYLRRAVLYPVYFSGGNIEWYFGYHALPLGGDMRTENFTTREPMFRYMRYARQFMQQLPFWEMEPVDHLHSDLDAQVFAKAGDTYAVFVPNASTSGNLQVQPGTYTVQWFNPRSGEFEGPTVTTSDSPIVFGAAPNTPGQDWVMLVRAIDEDNSATTTEIEPQEETQEEIVETNNESNPSPQDTGTTPITTENTEPGKLIVGGSIDWLLLFLMIVILSGRNACHKRST